MRPTRWLLFIAAFTVFVWLMLAPALRPAYEPHGANLPRSIWIETIFWNNCLSLSCGLVCGAALGAAFVLRSKRTPETGR